MHEGDEVLLLSVKSIHEVLVVVRAYMYESDWGTDKKASRSPRSKTLVSTEDDWMSEP